MTVTGGCRRESRAPRQTAPVSFQIPRDAFRFEIESVDDSIARFRPAEVRWLRPGMPVYAVDPTRRDALVARLRIVDADSGRMRALVVGQVTAVSQEHVLLAVRPYRPWYRDRRFWAGVITGALAGAGSVAIGQ